jgi:hypothetical protein
LALGVQNPCRASATKCRAPYLSGANFAPCLPAHSRHLSCTLLRLSQFPRGCFPRPRNRSRGPLCLAGCIFLAAWRYRRERGLGILVTPVDASCYVHEPRLLSVEHERRAPVRHELCTQPVNPAGIPFCRRM